MQGSKSLAFSEIWVQNRNIFLRHVHNHLRMLRISFLDGDLGDLVPSISTEQRLLTRLRRKHIFPQPGLPWGSYSQEEISASVVQRIGSPGTFRWFPWNLGAASPSSWVSVPLCCLMLCLCCPHVFSLLSPCCLHAFSMLPYDVSMLPCVVPMFLRHRSLDPSPWSLVPGLGPWSLVPDQ